MSSANEAFEKLLGKNALTIPVATPAVEANGRDGRSATHVREAGTRGMSKRGTMPERGGASGAVRVFDVFEENENPADYSPRPSDSRDSERIFTTPTETELDPVADQPDTVRLENPGNPPPGPHREGSTRRVADEDIDTGDADTVGIDSDMFPETAADIVDTGDGEENGVRGDTDIDPGIAAELRKARRFRRFSYLPLAGAEHFESRARDIMASLCSRTPDEPSLAVAGPSRGDGQTELAIRLALAMAKRVDYRVLLADFDVRAPQIAKRLGLSSKHFTLADVLRGACPLGEALMAGEEDNLYVLPARASDRVGDEVLNDKQVQALMANIHANFDFAVISCGAADHADAAIVCRHAGATALAAFCGRTPAKSLRETSARFAEAGANVVGMLLTGA